MMMLGAASHLTHVGLLLAGVLVAAVIGIRLTRVVHVPRVVGYLVLGIALRISVQWAVGGADAFHQLLGEALPTAELFKSLALCLILFAIGTEFDAAHLKAVGHTLWKLTAAEAAAVGSGVLVAVWLVTRETVPVQGIFLATAAIATAPAATLHVLRQYEAKGAVTDHILAMTGLNNLASIVLFYVAFLLLAETGAIQVGKLEYGLFMALVLATVGSALLGFVLGLVLSMLCIAITRFESILAFFAIMLAISVTAAPLGLNALIICMFMGLTFTNFSIQPRRLRDDLVPLSGPILALFFVLAGFKLELSRLWQVGLVGVAFIAMRLGGKIIGARFGVQWAGLQYRVTPQIGLGMLCQAGVAIGLGKYLMEHWGREVNGAFVSDPGAEAVNTVIIASVAFFELIGPLGTKRTVVRAGEVKAVSLLARPGGSVREMSTVLKRLARLVSGRQAKTTEQPENVVTVRHAMRTNVETLNQGSSMVEVLHFVERSRFNHFFVVDDEGQFVGTIDFRDLRNLMFNPMMAHVLTAYDMANTAPAVALADQPLDDMLDLFHTHDVGSLPVIESHESRRLLGVVEQRDVLRLVHTNKTGEQVESEH